MWKSNAKIKIFLPVMTMKDKTRKTSRQNFIFHSVDSTVYSTIITGKVIIGNINNIQCNKFPFTYTILYEFADPRPLLITLQKKLPRFIMPSSACSYFHTVLHNIFPSRARKMALLPKKEQSLLFMRKKKGSLQKTLQWKILKSFCS